jgi:Trypsin-co-occurring domain 1
MDVLISVPLEDGGRIVMEADPQTQVGPVPAGRAGEIVAEAGQTFESTLSAIVPTAEVLLDKLKAVGPDDITVEFGIKISIEAGAIITKTAGEANFTVTLTWKREEPA